MILANLTFTYFSISLRDNHEKLYYESFFHLLSYTCSFCIHFQANFDTSFAKVCICLSGLSAYIKQIKFDYPFPLTNIHSHLNPCSTRTSALISSLQQLWIYLNLFYTSARSEASIMFLLCGVYTRKPPRHPDLKYLSQYSCPQPTSKTICNASIKSCLNKACTHPLPYIAREKWLTSIKLSPSQTLIWKMHCGCETSSGYKLGYREYSGFPYSLTQNSSGGTTPKLQAPGIYSDRGVGPSG